MNKPRKESPKKKSLSFKWVESDPFELKPVLRRGAEALPTSDTAFLIKSKLAGRDSRIPRP